MMDILQTIGQSIHEFFEVENQVRETAISHARALTRACATTIRAIHRKEWQEADQRLEDVRQAAQKLNSLLNDHPDLYYAGYTQDALKEYAEAFLTYALIRSQPIPDYRELGIIPRTYINGLSEAASELRRYILDAIRQGEYQDAERLLDIMDAIYMLSMSIDFPDAITGGLRRRTDSLRMVLERTLGDFTMSIQQNNLEKTLRDFQDNYHAEP